MMKNKQSMSVIFSFFILFMFFSGQQGNTHIDTVKHLDIEAQQQYSYLPQFYPDSPIIRPSVALDTYREQSATIDNNIRNRQQDNQRILSQQEIALRQIDTIVRHVAIKQEKKALKPLKTARNSFRWRRHQPEVCIDTVVVVKHVKKQTWLGKILGINKN